MIVLRWRSAGAAVRRPALGIFRVIVGTSAFKKFHPKVRNHGEGPY